MLFGIGLKSIQHNKKNARKWLNWTEKFSSVQKFTFLVNFELNSVHFFAEGTWTELSSVFEWTWTKNEQKSLVHFSIIKTKISWHILIKKCGYHCQFLFIKNSKLFLKKLIIFKTLPHKNASKLWILAYYLQKYFLSELKNERKSSFFRSRTELSSVFKIENLNFISSLFGQGELELN